MITNVEFRSLVTQSMILNTYIIESAAETVELDIKHQYIENGVDP